MELHEIIQKFDIEKLKEVNVECLRIGKSMDEMFFQGMSCLGQLLNTMTLRQMFGESESVEKLEIMGCVLLTVIQSYYTLSEEEVSEFIETKIPKANKGAMKMLEQAKMKNTECDEFNVEVDMVQ